MQLTSLLARSPGALAGMLFAVLWLTPRLVPAAETAPLPGPFREPTGADRERFRALRAQLDDLQSELLDPRVAGAQEQALRANLGKVKAELSTLLSREERWKRCKSALSGATGTPSADFSAIDAGMTELLKEYAKLEKNKGAAADFARGEEWEILAARFSRYDQTISAQIASKNLSRAAGGSWLRRHLLLKGECYLNASVAFLRVRNPASDTSFIDLYVAGLETLELVVSLATADNELLGDMSVEFGEHLELTGCRTLSDTQATTTAMARALLADYCPWGLAVFRVLHEAGLTRGFDFRMLAPYAPVRSWTDLAADALSETPNVVPKLSETDLFGKEIPANVDAELRDAIGDRAKGVVLRAGKLEPLQWIWVQKDPVVKLWFVSPAVFQGGIQDAVEWAWRAVKLLFMGPYGLAVDEAIGLANTGIGELLGKDDPIFAVTTLLVDGNDMGFDSSFLLGEEGLLERTAVKDRRFDWSALVRYLGTKAAERFAKYEIECLFDGIDPQLTGLPPQKSYDGRQIPPIIIQAEVFGFDKVTPYEYQRAHRIVRYFQLDLSALANLPGEYNLSKSPVNALPLAAAYLSGDRTAHLNAWDILPTTKEHPLGRREYVTDFAPRSQLLHLTFDQETFKALTTGRDGRPVETLIEIVTMDKPSTTVLQAVVAKPELWLQIINYRAIPSVRTVDVAREAVQRMVSDAVNPIAYGELTPGFEGNDRLIVFAEQYAWARLRTAYEIVVGRRPNQQASLQEMRVHLPRTYADHPFSEELARIPIRWLSFRDPATGEIMQPTGTIKSVQGGAGSVRMDLTHGRAQLVNEKPIPLAANFVDLLPPKLHVAIDSGEGVGSSAKNPNVDCHVTYRADSVRIVGRLAGYGLKAGYYKADVTVGRVGYVMWGRVRSQGGGAYMECEIPLPVGMTQVTTTVAGFPAVTFTVQRNPPDNPPNVDIPALQAAVDAGYRKYVAYPSLPSAFGNPSVALATGYARLGRYQESYDIFQKLHRALPSFGSQEYVDTLSDVAYRVGDAKTCMELQVGRAQSLVNSVEDAYRRRQGDFRSEASAAAYRYAEILRRWVSMGGDRKAAEDLWIVLRRMEALGYRDSRPLILGFAIELGPAEGR